MSMISVETRCPRCKKYSMVNVYQEDYLNWQFGTLAQRAFPYLDANEREMLISGTCPTCWDEMFGFDDDEEYAEYESEEYDLEMGFDPYEGGYTFDC